ncbi:hypothetical protein ACWDO0_28285 [Nocardia rhamnosiphila]
MTGPSLITHVAIVGAGVNGLKMGVSLLEADISDFVLLAHDNEVVGAHRMQRHLWACARITSAHYQEHDGTWILTTHTGSAFWAENIVFCDAADLAGTEIDIRGRDNVSLREQWAARHETFLGLAVPGFPNMYLLAGPNTFTLAARNPALTPIQIRYIVDCLRDHYDLGVPLEVRTEAMRRYHAWLDATPVRTVRAVQDFARHCNSALAFACADPDQIPVARPIVLPDLPAAAIFNRKVS